MDHKEDILNYININLPLGGLIPTLLKSYGLVKGNYTVSLSILNWSPRPPISEKSTFPGS